MFTDHNPDDGCFAYVFQRCQVIMQINQTSSKTQQLQQAALVFLLRAVESVINKLLLLFWSMQDFLMCSWELGVASTF